MPMFEYACGHCGHTQDEIRSYDNRDDHTTCEKCQQPMQRLEVARTFFKLKGRGWTDRSAGMK